MAITATPYQALMRDLTGGQHDFVNLTYSVALLTADYTPDLVSDRVFSDISSYEVSTSGTGYSAQSISTPMYVTDDTDNQSVTVQASAASWESLTATFRYAVIYSASSDKLVGYIDFGADRTYNAEPFQLSFPDGMLTIIAD